MTSTFYALHTRIEFKRDFFLQLFISNYLKCEILDLFFIFCQLLIINSQCNINDKTENFLVDCSIDKFIILAENDYI